MGLYMVISFCLNVAQRHWSSCRLQSLTKMSNNLAFNQVIGKWNIGLLANYDLVRDVYYEGVGNNTVIKIPDKQFYKLNSREFNSALSFIRPLDSSSSISVSGFYKSIRILIDNGKFVDVNQAPSNPSIYDRDNYAGAKIEYMYEKMNDKVLPTRGFHFTPSITYTTNITDNNSYVRFSGIAGFYLPLLKSVTLAVKAGGGYGYRAARIL